MYIYIYTSLSLAHVHIHIYAHTIGSKQSNDDKRTEPETHITAMAHHLLAEMGAFVHSSAQTLLLPDPYGLSPRSGKSVLVSVMHIVEEGDTPPV